MTGTDIYRPANKLCHKLFLPHAVSLILDAVSEMRASALLCFCFWMNSGAIAVQTGEFLGYRIKYTKISQK